VPIDIRSATVEDAAAIQRIYAPIVMETAISFEEVPPTIEEMAARIASTLKTHPYLVAVSGGKVCGYVYAGRHAERAAYRYSVDTTVYIAPEARGNGVGRALYTALLADLAGRGFHAAFAGIALPNPGSIRLHEQVGFTPLGIYREVGFKFGCWHFSAGGNACCEAAPVQLGRTECRSWGPVRCCSRPR
jgi:L-amino acid N-acyltransferase YncA